MTLTSTLLSAGGAILLSEVLGRGKVVYTRLLSLVTVYFLCCGAAGYLAAPGGGGLTEFVTVLLTGVPIMAAWLGFRIHLSNSITLELAELLADGHPRTVDQLATDYDVDGHIANRVAVLQDGGYLAADGDLIDSPKSRAIVTMIRVLCGPDGPRSVADHLRRRDLRQTATLRP